MLIDTIPESIPRAKVLEVLASIGIDPKWCVSLELKQNGIYAETFVPDGNGGKLINQDGPATHRVFVKFV